MNFQFYWLSRGIEKHIRVDASTETAAIACFKRVYPRRKVTRVVDVTAFVQNGFFCW